MERKGNDKRKRQMRARENRMLIGGGRKRIKWKGSITQEKKKDSNFTWMKNKKGRKFWRRRKEQIMIYKTGKREWNSIRRENRMNKNREKKNEYETERK